MKASPPNADCAANFRLPHFDFPLYRNFTLSSITPLHLLCYCRRTTNIGALAVFHLGGPPADAHLP